MPAGERLPGAPDREERIVLHVDMDCFYASCERRREPELEGEPLVVGMGYEEGKTVGAVATASYEAREYGVESAQAISAALDRLPRKAKEPENAKAGFYRPVDIDYYQDVASEVKEILYELGDTIREVSIDEAYLDVTERTAWEVAEGFGRHVKQRISREVGVPASVGVAPDMSTAKLASDYDKPDGLVVVQPDEVREFLAPIDIADVHGVGPVRARELRDLGIESAGDLAEADPYELEAEFGDRGRELHRRARGEDDRPVEPRGDPKSLSRESSFDGATEHFEEVREQAAALGEAVADRASRKNAFYRTIGVKVVTPPYDVHTRAESLPGPVDDPDLVHELSQDLLDEFADEPVRKVGVRVSNLDFSERDQASLTGFGDDGSTGESESEGGETERDRDWSRDDDPEGQASLGEFE
jgi:DNA polymerase IV (DinB-like DNA polymerase)